MTGLENIWELKRIDRNDVVQFLSGEEAEEEVDGGESDDLATFNRDQKVWQRAVTHACIAS